MKAKERADLLDAVFSSLAQLPNGRSSAAFKVAGFWGRLSMDVARHWASSETSGSERRALVRASFAALDAFLSQGSKFLLYLHEKDVYRLEPVAVTLLQEKRTEVDSKGELVERDSFLPFANKVRFLLNLAGRYSLPNYRVDVGDAGWQALRAAINKRDQLMHPKELEHLEVGEDDLRELKLGLAWLVNQLLMTVLLKFTTRACYDMSMKYPLDAADTEQLKLYVADFALRESDSEEDALEELRNVQALGGFASEKYIIESSRDLSQGILKLLQAKIPESKAREIAAFLRAAI